MTQFEYKKWVTENKYGIINEQNRYGISAVICDEYGQSTVVNITPDMPSTAQQETQYNSCVDNDCGYVCMCDEELSYYDSPLGMCATFCSMMYENNLFTGYIQGESNTLGQLQAQYDGYEIVNIGFDGSFLLEFDDYWCDDITTASLCDGFEAAIAPQSEAEFCEKCATMADAGVDTATIPNGEYCDCCKGGLEKRWTCTATGEKYVGYGPGMVPMGDAIPIGGTCVSSYGTVNADWPYATLGDCIDSGCDEPADPEGMPAVPDKGNKLKPLEEELTSEEEDK